MFNTVQLILKTLVYPFLTVFMFQEYKKNNIKHKKE